MVDEVASVLDPLLDFIFGLVEDRVHALANILCILLGDTEHRLRVVWWKCERCRHEGEEGQERNFHRCWLLWQGHCGRIRPVLVVYPAGGGFHVPAFHAARDNELSDTGPCNSYYPLIPGFV